MRIVGPTALDVQWVGNQLRRQVSDKLFPPVFYFRVTHSPIFRCHSVTSDRTLAPAAPKGASSACHMRDLRHRQTTQVDLQFPQQRFRQFEELLLAARVLMD